MKALIVEQARMLLTDEADDGDAMCRFVGGTPEVRSVDARSPLRAYRNRDGLSLGLQPNVLGTLLFREFHLIGERDVVLGNVVFLGVDGSGTVTDVPDWVVELAKGMVPDATLIRQALAGSVN